MCARIAEQVERMTSDLTEECHRLGVRVILGGGQGAQLVRPESAEPYTKEQLIGQCKGQRSMQGSEVSAKVKGLRSSDELIYFST